MEIRLWRKLPFYNYTASMSIATIDKARKLTIIFILNNNMMGNVHRN